MTTVIALEVGRKVAFEYTDVKGKRTSRLGVVNYIDDKKKILNIEDETATPDKNGNRFRSFNQGRIQNMMY